MSSIPGFLIHAFFLSTLLADTHTLLKWVAAQGQGGYLATLLQYWYFVALALVLYGFIFFYYIFVLKFTSISLLYPVYTGMSILFVLIASRFFFDEQLAGLQQCGAIFVIFGIALMSKC